jgi:hypothetical protein
VNDSPQESWGLFFFIFSRFPIDIEFARGIMPRRRNNMGKHVIQIPSEDGCLYVYDVR